jgi:hypothetical protein
MSVFDLLKGDGFGMMEMTAAIKFTPNVPTFFGDKGLFTPKPIRSKVAAIEQMNGALTIIQTTPDGAPIVDVGGDDRELHYFKTVRIAQKSTIQASELSDIRAFGSETEFKQLSDEILQRQTKLAYNIALTKERMRLGAISGIVLDSNNATIKDWYAEFNVTAPAAIAFAFPAGTGADTGTGAVYTKCVEISRAMQKAAAGFWLPGTRIEAICGDTFFDKLVATNETRSIYRAQLQAQANFGNITQSGMAGSFATFDYGGIHFVNYRGTDDGTTVGVSATTARFYPVGANPELFQEIQAPGESFGHRGQLGLPMYSMLEVDPSGLDEWARVHARSYGMFVCTRPLILQSGTA